MCSFGEMRCCECLILIGILVLLDFQHFQMLLTYLGMVGTIETGKQRTLSNAGNKGQALDVNVHLQFYFNPRRGEFPNDEVHRNRPES